MRTISVHIRTPPRALASRISHLASRLSLSLSLMHPLAGSPPAAPLLSLSRRGVRLPTAPAARRASSRQASPFDPCILYRQTKMRSMRVAVGRVCRLPCRHTTELQASNKHGLQPPQLHGPRHMRPSIQLRLSFQHPSTYHVHEAPRPCYCVPCQLHVQYNTSSSPTPCTYSERAHRYTARAPRCKLQGQVPHSALHQSTSSRAPPSAVPV